MQAIQKKIVIQGNLELLTGLHIGGSNDHVEIGSVDNPVVRRVDNNEPYIPGSSLKGKMRSLLDIALGRTQFTYNGHGDNVPKLFGAAGDKSHPSRVIVRDAFLTSSSSTKLKESEFTDMPFSEIKVENQIDRIKGSAKHPRHTERIPAGAIFDLNFIINIPKNGDEQSNNENELLNTFFDGLKLLENDYLGGNGSRGYGQIRLGNFQASALNINPDTTNDSFIQEASYDLGQWNSEFPFLFYKIT